MAPRWPQDGPKMAPRWPQDGPKRPQDGPKKAQEGPKMPQDGPKTAPRCFKMAPRWPTRSELDRSTKSKKTIRKSTCWRNERFLKTSNAQDRPQDAQASL